MGGSNAHIILEEFLSTDSAGHRGGTDVPGVVLLSAKDESRLREASKNLAGFCRSHPMVSLSDLAYTLQIGREAMNERMGLVVGSVSELERELEKFVEGQHTRREYWRKNSQGNGEAPGSHERTFPFG